VVALPVAAPEDAATAGEDRSSLVPGIRVGPDSALAWVPRGARLRAPPASDAPEVVAIDGVRGLVLVRAPATTEPVPWGGETGDASAGPRYVIAVEGGRAGPAYRPVFLPRADPVHDPHWDASVLVLGGAVQVQPGALLFSLRGRFLGLALAEHGVPSVVPAETLAAAADQLAQGRPPTPIHLGIGVQPLDATLARATAAGGGLLVTHVEAGGPAAGRLQFGDVIVAAEGQPVRSDEALLSSARRLPPGRPMRMQVVRNTQTLDVSLVPAADPRPRGPSADVGLTLRPLPRIGSEVVRVEPGGVAARAGLRAGDVLVHFGESPAPSPAQVSRTFAAAAPGQALLAGVERGGRRLAVAVVKE
jgi:hypothetical protein